MSATGSHHRGHEMMGVAIAMKDATSSRRAASKLCQRCRGYVSCTPLPFDDGGLSGTRPVLDVAWLEPNGRIVFARGAHFKRPFEKRSEVFSDASMVALLPASIAPLLAMLSHLARVSSVG